MDKKRGSVTMDELKKGVKWIYQKSIDFIRFLRKEVFSQENAQRLREHLADEKIYTRYAIGIFFGFIFWGIFFYVELGGEIYGLPRIVIYWIWYFVQKLAIPLLILLAFFYYFSRTSINMKRIMAILGTIAMGYGVGMVIWVIEELKRDLSYGLAVIAVGFLIAFGVMLKTGWTAFVNIVIYDIALAFATVVDTMLNRKEAKESNLYLTREERGGYFNFNREYGMSEGYNVYDFGLWVEIADSAENIWSKLEQGNIYTPLKGDKRFTKPYCISKQGDMAKVMIKKITHVATIAFKVVDLGDKTVLFLAPISYMTIKVSSGGFFHSKNHGAYYLLTGEVLAVKIKTAQELIRNFEVLELREVRTDLTSQEESLTKEVIEHLFDQQRENKLASDSLASELV